MVRLTRTEIVQNLLAGKKIEWKDTAGKTASIVLDTPKRRRLLEYLLASQIREVKNIPESCVKGLAEAFSASGDPATKQDVVHGAVSPAGSWKIHAIKSEGFGGVNAWKGKPFELELQGNSILLEGPNGSGKSSLSAAIIWALSGERPRDQAETSSDEVKPIFGTNNTKAGDWPPIASYPNHLKEVSLGANVSVELIFRDEAGALAKARRTFDGKESVFTKDAQLNIPPVLLEAGLLMPARLSKLRFDQGRGKLSEAVQTLTGLDDLIDLGTFVQGLCHKGRDYLSYKNTELALGKAQFERDIEAAKTALANVFVVVPNFKVVDTDDPNGPMAAFGKELNERAGALTKVVSDDLATGLDLSDPLIQKQLSLAISGAEADVAAGISGLQEWKNFGDIATTLPKEVRQKLNDSIMTANTCLDAAIDFHKKAESDTRFRLKAAAARWHAEHGSGEFDECPACEHSLSSKPHLKRELFELQSAGEAATRKLSDNVLSILAALENAVPEPLRRYLSGELCRRPCEGLSKAFEAVFVSAHRYQKYLAKFAVLSKAALATAPSVEMACPTAEQELVPGTASALKRIARVQQLCSLAIWFETEGPTWLKWWEELSRPNPSGNDKVATTNSETLSVHVQRIAKSLGEAEPFRVGAEALRAAYKQGLASRKIEKELEQRQAIADALAPLKTLGNMAEAQARDALNDLSIRIGQIHSANYVSDSLKFQSAGLDKKAGLVVLGQLGPEIRVDATLVANTSWIRGILWAFVFALREEAVEQMGVDVFPVMVLDDPQQTFDTIHRHRWAEYIAKLQSGAPGVQILLASHDEQFLSFLKVDGVTGRHALIASAGAELGHIGVFEGDELDRRWRRVMNEKTQKIAQDYMAAVRVHVEGMLKLMLRGEDTNVSSFVIGQSRDKLSVLHAAKHEPWARNVFDSLANLLGHSVAQIKYIEKAHHSDGANLGMTEAIDVQAYWSKTLRPKLENAFRTVREHRALHGGLSALHAMPPTIPLPDGRKDVVKQIKLPVVGSAAALSNGKAADGCVHLQLDGKANEFIELKSNVVYRLTTPTLEPVARTGDLLIVSEFKQPTAKSLVVARSESRLLARRLEIADNHSDVAALTANAINPRSIAPPVVAKLSTLTMQKVIGVIYDHGKSALGKIDGEVCDCGGDSVVRTAFSEMQGLVEVDGHSAEPHALHKQFLIIGKPVSVPEACKKLEGQPIIAEDSSGNRYFKRLRARHIGAIILESLEIGGGFPPVVLADSAGTNLHVQNVWPVLGVLFERPN